VLAPPPLADLLAGWQQPCSRPAERLAVLRAALPLTTALLAGPAVLALAAQPVLATPMMAQPQAPALAPALLQAVVWLAQLPLPQELLLVQLLLPETQQDHR